MSIRVIIKRNDFDEYEVPTDSPSHPASSFEAGLYFTDDREDALVTCQLAFDGDADIVWRRGSYQADFDAEFDADVTASLDKWLEHGELS